MDLTFFAQIRATVESLIHHPLWIGLGMGSTLFIFIASLALLPIFVSFIPEDYFLPSEERPQGSRKRAGCLRE